MKQSVRETALAMLKKPQFGNSEHIAAVHLLARIGAIEAAIDGCKHEDFSGGHSKCNDCGGAGSYSCSECGASKKCESCGGRGKVPDVCACFNEFLDSIELVKQALEDRGVHLDVRFRIETRLLGRAHLAPSNIGRIGAVKQFWAIEVVSKPARSLA